MSKRVHTARVLLLKAPKVLLQTMLGVKGATRFNLTRLVLGVTETYSKVHKTRPHVYLTSRSAAQQRPQARRGCKISPL